MAGVSLITGGKGQAERSVTDFYPTPTASTISLLTSGKLDLTKIQTVLEPAAGQRHISKVVSDVVKPLSILSTDLYDYGDPYVYTGVDFLTAEYNTTFDMVITNPPYDAKILLPFVKKALEVSNKYVCMFLKGTFLESTKRYEFFKRNKNLKHILIFSNRQPIYKNGIITKQSNAIMYAWFIWDKDYDGLPMVDWIDNSALVAKNKQAGIY